MKIKILLFLVLTILIPKSIQSHNEFLKWVNCNVANNINPSNCGSVLRWESWNSIPITTQWSYDFPYMEITGTSQFSSNLTKWPGVTFNETENGNIGDSHVIIRFSPDPANFPDPSRTVGGIIYSVKDGFIVAYQSNAPVCQGNLGHSWILLNNVPGRRSFTWTHDTFTPQGYVNFEGATCHELGHLLGLGHCSDSDALMYYTTDHRLFAVTSPTSQDIAGLNYLLNCTVNPCSPQPLTPNNLLKRKKGDYYTILEIEGVKNED